MLKRRDILQPQRSTNHHRTVARSLQHPKTEFITGIQAAGTGNHDPNRPKAGHALTFRLDRSVGAAHPGPLKIVKNDPYDPCPEIGIEYLFITQNII